MLCMYTTYVRIALTFSCSIAEVHQQGVVNCSGSVTSPALSDTSYSDMLNSTVTLSSSRMLTVTLSTEPADTPRYTDEAGMLRLAKKSSVPSAPQSHLVWGSSVQQKCLQVGTPPGSCQTHNHKLKNAM